VDSDPWRDPIRSVFQKLEHQRAVKLMESLTRDQAMLDQPAVNLVQLAWLLNGHGKPRLAIDFLRRAQQRRPGDVWINLFLGLLLTPGPAAEVGEAVGYLRAAVARRPQCFSLWIPLGNALRWQNEPAPAEAAYRQAIRLQPDFALTFRLLGSVLELQGKDPEAEAAFREALQRKDNAEDHRHLGWALLHQGKGAGAEIEFRAVLRSLPNDSHAHYQLGEAVERQGKDSEARSEYRAAAQLARNALRRDPQSSWEWQILGWAQYRLGEWKESIQSLKLSNTLQQSPQGGDYGQWLVLAMAYFRLGNQAEAQEWYDRAARWLEQNAPLDSDARFLQTEAASLLKTAGQAKPEPASK
jgi:tetratricopeptide (TPR) repeat protein